LTPETPNPLFPRAPTMPATCVPWPFVSIGFASFSAKS
jgi:hypothetical protein